MLSWQLKPIQPNVQQDQPGFTSSFPSLSLLPYFSLIIKNLNNEQRLETVQAKRPF